MRFRLAPPQLAVIVACTGAATGLVWMLKEPLVAPPATVADGGTPATAGLELVSLTTCPAAGAGPARVKRSETVLPPYTDS